ncbi:MAG: 4-hydroxythreonine-4-phosphate dehydrogenase PdxA [Acidiferrobacteraceae bacterium]
MSGTLPANRAPSPDRPVIAVTSGEPAGVGPELVARLLNDPWAARVALIGDHELVADRARRVGLPVGGWDTGIDIRLRVASSPGALDPRNAPYVMETLERAVQGCLDGEFDALVTGPVHKGILNDAGYPFTGHTEFLAEASATPLPVMLLVGGSLRVALATTHLALSDVPSHITRQRLRAVLEILDRGLRSQFMIARPRIVVLGLNPHAGEGGHLGQEEIEVIAPVIEACRSSGLDLIGPIPADTAFTATALAGVDAVLAMYHDQGLPVLKHQSFGEAVNVTLGLPFPRTSVDHGTALALAGTGQADVGSFRAALRLALTLCGRLRTSRAP